MIDLKHCQNKHFRDVNSGMQKIKKTNWKSYFFASPDSPSENLVFSQRNGTPFHEKYPNGDRKQQEYNDFRDVNSGMQKSKKTNWKSYFFASPDSPSGFVCFNMVFYRRHHGNQQNADRKQWNYQLFRNAESGMQKSKRTNWNIAFSVSPDSRCGIICSGSEIETLFAKICKMRIENNGITNCFATRNRECKKARKPI